ncbi:hypothetical protein PCANC_11203 [Puccinia coronata f. sp. avenae]|uniref:Uncharacterized protein n=1 Tax=Puccinia coronata f. sp. avenae TaxID=200324 RepID=A0A2N5V8K6_9BASI|nr:hypothetical protein PCANC_10179 [Puccinia coronata f. sp. avenae]PLW46333.1 hypothetical protein PCANC_11203 [Puccinia coronata f. sp. avenae]
MLQPNYLRSWVRQAVNSAPGRSRTNPIIRELGIPSDRSDQVILGDRLLVEDSVCGENARTFGLDNQFESKKAAEWVVTLSSRGRTTAEYVIIFNYDDYDDCP